MVRPDGSRCRDPNRDTKKTNPVFIACVWTGHVNAAPPELTEPFAVSSCFTTFGREGPDTKVRRANPSTRPLEAGANLRLASVDHVIERLIMTVIETCSVGAVVCVSKNRHRLQSPTHTWIALSPI